jgi:hypothetical protein
MKTKKNIKKNPSKYQEVFTVNATFDEILKTAVSKEEVKKNMNKKKK